MCIRDRCTVDSLTVASVYSNSFGNTTVVLMVFCYMLAACLVKSGVARRIAIWFLTNKIARKSPWGLSLIHIYFKGYYLKIQ